MSEACDTEDVSAAAAFDAALARARSFERDPPPFLPRIDPEKAPSRTVAGLRKMLALRYAHAVPAAELASLHRQAILELNRLERRLRRRRIATLLMDFLRSYGWVIFGLLVLGALIGLAYAYREPILAFVEGLLAAAPIPAGPGATTPPTASDTAAPPGTVP